MSESSACLLRKVLQQELDKAQLPVGRQVSLVSLLKTSSIGTLSTQKNTRQRPWHPALQAQLTGKEAA